MSEWVIDGSSRISVRLCRFCRIDESSLLYVAERASATATPAVVLFLPALLPSLLLLLLFKPRLLLIAATCDFQLDIESRSTRSCASSTRLSKFSKDSLNTVLVCNTSERFEFDDVFSLLKIFLSSITDWFDNSAICSPIPAEPFTLPGIGVVSSNVSTWSELRSSVK